MTGRHASRDGTSTARWSSMAELVSEVERASDPERALVQLALEELGRLEPARARVIRAAAIARRIDRPVIKTLMQVDDAEAQDLLTFVISQPFVEHRPDGTHALHDTSRDELLRDWRDRDPETFARLNEQLAAHYLDLHERTRPGAAHLSRVAGVVQAVRQERFIQFALAVESVEVSPLLEAIYHLAMASADKGLEALQKYFCEYEDEGRYSVGSALIDGLRDASTRLPPGEWSARHDAWLAYFQGRLLNRQRRYEEAASTLGEVLASCEGDARLRLWALSEQGVAFEERLLFGDARHRYKEALALADTSHEDPWNVPIDWLRLAGVASTLEDYEEAETSLERAVRSARESGNRPAEVFALTELSAIREKQGDWRTAFDAALGALHIARTDCSTDASQNRLAARRVMEMLVKVDPHVADSILHECLKAAAGQRAAQCIVRNAYIEAAIAAGRLRAALSQAEKLSEEARVAEDTWTALGAAYNSACVLHAMGRLSEAEELLLDVCRRATEREVILGAQARTVAALIWMDVGRLDDADSALLEAAEVWRKIGHDRMLARSVLHRADVALLKGAQTAAHGLLAEANSHSVPTLDLRALRESVSARVCASEGRHVEAAEHHGAAADLYHALRRDHEAARAHLARASALGEVGDFARAAESASIARDRYAALAAADGYTAAEQVIDAQRRNADAMSNFVDATGVRHRSLQRAREQLEAACTRDRDNWWFQLNRAYVERATDDVEAASKTLKRLVASAPEYLTSSRLEGIWTGVGPFSQDAHESAVAGGEEGAG